MLLFNLNSLCGSYLLGLIDTERIDHSIALANAHALEQRRRIVMLRMIAKAKLPAPPTSASLRGRCPTYLAFLAFLAVLAFGIILVASLAGVAFSGSAAR